LSFPRNEGVPGSSPGVGSPNCRENIQAASAGERGFWNTLEHRSDRERGNVPS
jgi:hypothetical protein